MHGGIAALVAATVALGGLGLPDSEPEVEPPAIERSAVGPSEAEPPTLGPTGSDAPGHADAPADDDAADLDDSPEPTDADADAPGDAATAAPSDTDVPTLEPTDTDPLAPADAPAPAEALGPALDPTDTEAPAVDATDDEAATLDRTDTEAPTLDPPGIDSTGIDATGIDATGIEASGIEASAHGRRPAYPVRASADGASLVDAKGHPFLYLADTVWLAPSRLDRDGMRHLLDVRAAQGFTTVQVSVLPFVHLPGGLANAHGDTAVRGTDLSAPREIGRRTSDPRHPHYDYWDHLDVLLTLAADRGMQLTLVPSWYGYLGEDWRGHVDARSARAYGRFLGARLGHHRNLMWLLGGDNDPVGNAQRARGGSSRSRDVLRATRAMAEAIRQSEAVPHLMSYHTSRSATSLDHFARDRWHTFASAYSGALTWREVTRSRGRGVPVVLTESYYDGREEYTVLDRREQRAQAWWSVLGGAGYAYGHEDVWDLDPGHGPHSRGGAASWRHALGAASARDVGVLARTVDDLLPLTPADDVFVAGRSGGSARASAARSADGRTALVYVAQHRTIEVKVAALGRRGFTAAWLDPATGARRAVAVPRADYAVRLRPPADLDDAVLVLRRR